MTRKGRKQPKFKSHTRTSISSTLNKVGIPLQYQGFKAEILTLHRMYTECTATCSEIIFQAESKPHII